MNRQTTIRNLLVAASILTIGITIVAPSFAQRGDIARRRQRPGTSWRMRGEIGQSYRPRSAAAYQQAARQHAQALNEYGQTAEQLPADTAQEHLAEIRRNLDASQREVARLGDLLNDPEVKPHVEAMQQHYAEAARMCDMIEGAVSADGVDTVMVCQCCVNIDKELEAAGAEQDQILQILGIEPLNPVVDTARGAGGTPDAITMGGKSSFRNAVIPSSPRNTGERSKILFAGP